jgi:hypothetical protein
MAQQIKILYRNILELAIVEPTDEDVSFPGYRLYDRDIGKLFKGDSTTNPFLITLDQDVTVYAADRLIIPPGHNLDGLSLKIQYSTDNFGSDIHDAVSWVQSGSGLIDKSFATQTKQYWRLNIAAPAQAPELPEMFLGPSYTFVVNPLFGAREGRKRNELNDETRSGLDFDVQFGDLKEYRAYEFKDMGPAQKTEFKALETLCGGIKPFWIEDHLGIVIYGKKINEEDFGYDGEDADAFYSYRLEFRQVLGRTI